MQTYMHAYLWYFFINKRDVCPFRNFDPFIHFVCVCRKLKRKIKRFDVLNTLYICMNEHEVYAVLFSFFSLHMKHVCQHSWPAAS